MKRYYINKVSTTFYSAIIEANTIEEAQELFQHVDLNDCFCEETCAEINESRQLEDGEIYDLPLIK